MIEFVSNSLLLNLLYALLVVLLLFLLLRFFDHRMGITFKDCWNEIVRDQNTAMAAYLGLRFVGCCILLGLIIS